MLHNPYLSTFCVNLVELLSSRDALKAPWLFDVTTTPLGKLGISMLVGIREEVEGYEKKSGRGCDNVYRI